VLTNTMRRTAVLTCAALVLLCGLWVAAPALSLSPYVPRAVDFELAVDPPSSQARAAGGRWTSPVIRAPKRFDLLGLKWRSASGHVDAQVRVRRSGGIWSAWTEAPDAHDGPDGRDELRGTEPVWAGPSDELQLRTRRRPRGLRIHFVNASGSATRAERARTAVRRALHAGFVSVFSAATARAAGEQPAIVTRAEWGADQCPPRDVPSYGTVQMAFVHHTVNANEYTPDQARSMVLGICRYHRNSNGWDDLGYNFLVDKYGTIYEGRAGGIDQPVVGAQVQGWNTQSTGIANLGTHSTVAQSEVALDAIARLIAWKLPLHGVPVTGQVALRSGGGSENRYPAGTMVALDRISGHRDGGKSECPGEALYAQLPQLRAMAQQRAPAVVPLTGRPGTITARLQRTKVVYPAPAQVTGFLAGGDGLGVGGAPIEVQIGTDRGFKTAARGTTAADGTYLVPLVSSRNRTVRVIYRAPSAPVVSPRLALRVAPGLATRIPASRIQAGRRLVLRGRVTPRRSVLYVVADREVRRGRYARSFTIRGSGARGTFRIPVRLRRPGLYRVSVRTKGDRRNPVGSSGYVHVRAVRRAADVSRGGMTAPSRRR
jgi:hypothetical protein